MTYNHNLDREDIQNDTFSIIAGLIALAIDSQLHDYPEGMYKPLKSIYSLVWSRIKDEKIRKKVEASFEGVRETLYTNKIHNPVEYSRAFEECEALLMLMSKELNDMKLLFKTVVDYGEMVAK